MPEAEFAAYHPDSSNVPRDPLTIDLDVPGSRPPGPVFEPAFGLNLDNAGMGDALIGLAVILVLGLLSLLLGGVRWVWQAAWYRSRNPKGKKVGRTSLTLTSEGLTCSSFDGQSSHVQWTHVDAVHLARTADDVLRVEWRLAVTGEVQYAVIGPGVERGNLGLELARYAGDAYGAW